MIREEERLEDGRRILFYTFEDEEPNNEPPEESSGTEGSEAPGE